MEIEKTFIVEKGTMGNDKRFVRVYLSCGRYFLHSAPGSMSEISEKEFLDMCNYTKSRKE